MEQTDKDGAGSNNYGSSGNASAPHVNGYWPDYQVALILVAFALLWVIHLDSTSLSVPTDNIEQLNWVHSIEFGYYKHPPFPTWLFWPLFQLFGPHGWTTYIAAAAINLASFAILWILLKNIRGNRFATLALLGVLCITYYSMRFHAYNHNTVLMLVSTVCAALCWRAHVTRKLIWWIALGLVMGIGLLTKYQIAITMVCVTVFWLTQSGWRDPKQRLGILLSYLTALIIFVPHVQWLRTHDFGPIAYAVESSLGARVGAMQRVTDVVEWLLDQLLNRTLPAWLLLVVAIFVSRKRRPRATTFDQNSHQTPLRDSGHYLLLCWGFVPLAFMVLTELVAGSRLNLRWGSPFLLFVIPSMMELLTAWISWNSIPTKAVITAFASVQVLLLCLSYITSPFGPPSLRERHWRAFDSVTLGRQIELPMREKLAGRPVCIISGPTYVAGALSLQLAERPLVLIDGRLDRSPWIDAKALKDCAILQLIQGSPLPGSQLVGPSFPKLWWRVLLPPISLAAGGFVSGEDAYTER